MLLYRWGNWGCNRGWALPKITHKPQSPLYCHSRSLCIPPTIGPPPTSLHALLLILSPMLSSTLSQFEKSCPWLLLSCSPRPCYLSRSFLRLDTTLPPTTLPWTGGDNRICAHPGIPAHPRHESSGEACGILPDLFLFTLHPFLFDVKRLFERKEKFFFKKRPQFQQQSVQFSHSVVADSLRPHELQHARQKIKYLRIILTRNALHLHEDFKVDLKDTKGNLNKQKDTMGWSGRLLILKMSVFFTQIHKFNVTSIKIVTGFLMDNITARSN